MAAVAEIKLFGKWYVECDCRTAVFDPIAETRLLIACRTFADVEVTDLALKVCFGLK